MTSRTSHRLGLALAAGTSLLLVVGAGALGIVGDGGRADWAYVTVLAVLLVGSAVARLRAPAMVLVLAATALTQTVVTASLLLADVHRTAGGNVADVLMVNALYVAGFGVAAALSHRATRPAGRGFRRPIARPGT